MTGSEPETIKVGVAYAISGQQLWLTVELAPGATVQDAIERSGILEKFPEINLEEQKVGVFGKVAMLDAEVKEGDRVEIYRAITADPKAVKRKKAAPVKKPLSKKTQEQKAS